MSAAPQLVVHHLNDSRSQRLLWLLEELEVPYELKKYQRVQMLAPKELEKVHPLGKAPIITDGDVTLAESGAIIEYIIHKYGPKLQPSESSYADNLYWTHYSEGTLMPLLVNKLLFTIAPSRVPFLIRPLANTIMSKLLAVMVDPRLKVNGEMIEAHLSKSKSGWFAGDDHPTAADFMMSFPLETLLSRQADALGPSSKAYVDKIHARPAYKRGLEKGGEYSYA